MFLLNELPPWHNNRLRGLLKIPKLHMRDTGTFCSLLGVRAADLTANRTLLGPLLETFVFQDIKRQASWYEQPLKLSHYRDRDGVEVDIVIEKGNLAVAGIEIKTAASVTTKDFRRLKNWQLHSVNALSPGVASSKMRVVLFLNYRWIH